MENNIFFNESSKYKVKTGEFEGPLDLLCHFVDINQMDIYEISLSKITDQYINYLKNMQELDLEVTSEFIVMASNLLYIKSSKLLPKHENEEEDMLTEEELIERIIKYKQYKDISNKLKKLYEENNKRFFRISEKLDIPNQKLENEYGVNNISDMYKQILERNKVRINKNARNIEKIAINDKYSVGDSVKNMYRALLRNSNFIFNNLYSLNKCEPEEIITAFSGLLEMSRRDKVITNQEKLFGDIVVKNKRNKLRF